MRFYRYDVLRVELDFFAASELTNAASNEYTI